MTSSQEAPALIQYACERCKTRFVLPPSRRKLSLAGKARSFSTALKRTVRYREGLGSAYDTARRQLLAKMDDEAYQSFVQSFRFCHECRQFVCNECWSTSRRSCLTCVAKSMTGAARPRPPFAPTGPEIPRPVAPAVAGPRNRLRRDAAFVALALVAVLIVGGAGMLLANQPSPAPAAIPEVTATPISTATAAPTATPEVTLAATPTSVPAVSVTPIPTAVSTPAPTATPTAAASAPPTLKPTPTPFRATPAPTAPPVITPAPVTPPPDPVISCPAATAGAPFTCSWTNPWTADSVSWFAEGAPVAATMTLPQGTYTIQMIAVRAGTNYYGNTSVTVGP